MEESSRNVQFKFETTNTGEGPYKRKSEKKEPEEILTEEIGGKSGSVRNREAYRIQAPRDSDTIGEKRGRTLQAVKGKKGKSVLQL